MWTTSSYIKNHIAKLPRGTIFTTREMLIYGTRNTVDRCMYKLVNSNQIVRLVRGVFVRPAKNKPLPTIEEIAQVKARSFARTSVVHRKDCAKELDIAEKGNDRKKHLCSGRTSSFGTIHGRVYSHATSPRKMNVGSGNTGRVIKALWSIGKKEIDTNIVKKALSTLKKSDWNIFFTIFHYMPHWMTDFVHYVESDRIDRWILAGKPRSDRGRS